MRSRAATFCRCCCVALLFGFALSAAGPRCKPVVDLFTGLTHAVFGVINILMRLAPIGAFGAMAFTIGQYGVASLGPLVKLIAMFYVTCILFVLIVLGAIARARGLQHLQIPSVYQRRDHSGAGGQFVGACPAAADGEDGTARLLQGAGGAGGADRLHVQHRRHQHLHDAGGAVCGAGHRHPSHAGAATDHPRRGRADFQGSERRAGRGFHRAGGNPDGDSDDSGGGDGVDSGNRSLHEHVPSRRQHDRQRRSHGGGGALGTGDRYVCTFARSWREKWKEHATVEASHRVHVGRTFALLAVIRRGAGIAHSPRRAWRTASRTWADSGGPEISS